MAERDFEPDMFQYYDNEYFDVFEDLYEDDCVEEKLFPEYSDWFPELDIDDWEEEDD